MKVWLHPARQPFPSMKEIQNSRRTINDSLTKEGDRWYSGRQREKDCITCKKLRGIVPLMGSAVYESDRLLISHLIPGEGDRHHLGHFLIEPKRHIEGLGELTDIEAAETGRMTTRLSHALKESEGVDLIYPSSWATTFPPSYPCDPPLPRCSSGILGGRVNEWPDAPRGGKEAIEALCERVRRKLI